MRGVFCGFGGRSSAEELLRRAESSFCWLHDTQGLIYIRRMAWYFGETWLHHGQASPWPVGRLGDTIYFDESVQSKKSANLHA